MAVRFFFDLASIFNTILLIQVIGANFECGKTSHNLVDDARIHSPWTALVHNAQDKTATVGGVIIGPYTLLTIGEAVEHLHPSTARINVGIGKRKNFEPDTFTQSGLEPAYIFAHGELALIQLKNRIKFSTRVRPLCVVQDAQLVSSMTEVVKLPKLLSGFHDLALMNKLLNDSWTWDVNPANCAPFVQGEVEFFTGSSFAVWMDNHWHVVGLVNGAKTISSTCAHVLSEFIDPIQPTDLSWIFATVKNGGKNVFTCFSGESVPLLKLCDGKLDCKEDGFDEDEVFCAARNGEATEFHSQNSHQLQSREEVGKAAQVHACGTPKIAYGTRIINGSRVRAESDWPWSAALFRRDEPGGDPSYICGATLISPNALLTAAHCVADSSTGLPEPGKLFQVIVIPISSEYVLNLAAKSKAQVVNISSIHVHENYDPTSLEADIAILGLSPAVRLSENVYPVCIPNREQEPIERTQTRVGSVGTVLGFGFYDSTSRKISPTLQVVQLSIVSPRDCRAVSNLSPTVAQLCVGANGSAVCNGDSGGGLVFQYGDNGPFFIQGIVSHGQKTATDGSVVCDPNKYSIFTRVGAFKAWMAEVLAEKYT